MAYFDHQQAHIQEEELKKYEELKKFITSTDENKKVNDFYPAHDHLMRMESTISEQQKELEKYREFFVALSGFLPKEFTIHDRIF